MRFRAGGRKVKAGFSASHTEFQAKKTTPKATAIVAATTMSTVRHRCSGIRFPPRAS